MNRTITNSLFVSMLLMLMGCTAHRSRQSFHTIVSPDCLTAPIVLRDCDSSAGQMYCKHVDLKYKRGCEQIEVNGAKITAN